LKPSTSALTDVQDQDLIVLEKLLQVKEARLNFALNYHRNTHNEPMDFEHYPHVREYGADVVHVLRNQGHIVYDIQRHIRPLMDELFDTDLELKNWVSCDFMQAHEVVGVATGLLEDKVKLDGVVHAVAHCEDLDHRLLSTHDMSKHFIVNVFGPLLLTVYLQQAAVLNMGARIIFLLDQRKLPIENIMYAAAKASIRSIVSEFGPLFDGIDFMYVSLPDRKTERSDDADERVVRFLTRDELPKNKHIIL